MRGGRWWGEGENIFLLSPSSLSLSFFVSSQEEIFAFFISHIDTNIYNIFFLFESYFILFFARLPPPPLLGGRFSKPLFYFFI